MNRPKIDPRKHEKLSKTSPAEPANTELSRPGRARDPNIDLDSASGEARRAEIEGLAAARSLSHAQGKMEDAGYTEQFRAEDGALRAVGSGTVHAPEDLVVDQIARFEGVSDPDDQSAVFALRDRSDGTKGTFTIAYGPGMDPQDADIASRLKKKKTTKPS